MRKLLFVLAIICSVYYLDHKYSHQEDLVLSFGNIEAKYNYSYDNTKITDIINDIKTNEKVGNRYLQNLLVKAKYIYIDLNDLIIFKSYKSVIQNMEDLTILINLIRKYCKEKIFVKLLESSDEGSIYINEKVMISLKKYDIIFMR